MLHCTLFVRCECTDASQCFSGNLALGQSRQAVFMVPSHHAFIIAQTVYHVHTTPGTGVLNGVQLVLSGGLLQAAEPLLLRIPIRPF